MNENQKKWLLYLQEKGVRIDLINLDGTVVEINIDPFSGRKPNLTFAASAKNYRLHAQLIPDIPDWRELCREMQSKGVRFKMLWGSMWNEDRHDFEKERDRYQLIEQPLPEWREEMAEEIKPDPREEIPHRELQIQWHEDWLHHLRTGEPMREWEVRFSTDDNVWRVLDCLPSWHKNGEYRRKPRTVTYWHCVGGYEDSGGKKDTVWFASGDRHDVFSETERYKARYPLAKFGPIIETTVEVED